MVLKAYYYNGGVELLVLDFASGHWRRMERDTTGRLLFAQVEDGRRWKSENAPCSNRIFPIFLSNAIMYDGKILWIQDRQPKCHRIYHSCGILRIVDMNTGELGWCLIDRHLTCLYVAGRNVLMGVYEVIEEEESGERKRLEIYKMRRLPANGEHVQRGSLTRVIKWSRRHNNVIEARSMGSRGVWLLRYKYKFSRNCATLDHHRPSNEREPPVTFKCPYWRNR